MRFPSALSLTILLFTLFPSPAKAAYRVHYLKITEYGVGKRPLRVRRVLSPLDHLQYEHYHTGYRRMRVELLGTWYCPGDTHRHDYCHRPMYKTPRGPASSREDKKWPWHLQPVIP